jgi:hypothetical protein
MEFSTGGTIIRLVKIYGENEKWIKKSFDTILKEKGRNRTIHLISF